MPMSSDIIAFPRWEEIHPDRQANVVREPSLVSNAIESRLIQCLPGWVLACEILHGCRWHWMQNLSQIVEIPGIRIWLEVLCQTPVDLQPIGQIMLSNDCVCIALSFLCQHNLQLIDRAWIDAQIREIRFQHWRSFVFRPFHSVVKLRLQ